jgi:hypothetical protein
MILHRLVKDNKVVGYQKLEGGRILHNCLLYAMEKESANWYDILTIDKKYSTEKMSSEIYHPYYISHDRVDRWTGVEIKGEKVFERDQVKGETLEGVVRFEDGSFVVHFEHASCYLSSSNKLKIIGIQGVKEG